jgi:very-short-patch-repair endonuclease
MAWGEIARSQAGAITRAQLREAGLEDHVIDHLLTTGALDADTPGVFVARGAPRSYRNRLWTALLATRGVLGFATAAALWGISAPAPARIDVIVEHERRVKTPYGVRIHRVFVPQSAVVHHDRLRVTTRTWTVLDHLGRLPDSEAFRLADRSLQRGWLTSTDLDQRLREYPGRRGNRLLREIAGRCGDGAAAESERVLHRLLQRAGVSGWVPNHRIWSDGALIAVADVAVPAAGLIIEIDGWAFHSDVDRFQRDRQRQNALVALGWRVVRFTWADLTQRPGYVIAMIRAQVARAS